MIPSKYLTTLLGAVMFFGGVAVIINALISGPHAFLHQEKAVAVMCAAGIALCWAGIKTLYCR